MHLYTIFKNAAIFEKEMCFNCDKKRTRVICKADKNRDKLSPSLRKLVNEHKN